MVFFTCPSSWSDSSTGMANLSAALFELAPFPGGKPLCPFIVSGVGIFRTFASLFRVSALERVGVTILSF